MRYIAAPGLVGSSVIRERAAFYFVTGGLHVDQDLDAAVSSEKMVLTASAVASTEPLVSFWYYLGCVGFILVSGLNYWRFRTGWRMTGKAYKRGYTEYAIRMGYASLPYLVAGFGALLVGVLGTLASREHSALFGVGTLVSAVIVIGGILSGVKEYKRPSRWNSTPPWLVEARRRGRLR